MGYQVLARKYRPQRFADVVGQDHVTVTLMNALRQDRIAHGYIFSGHRGIGKTTIARILACALNCRNPIGSPARPTPEPCEVCESCLEIRAGNSVDVIEIDAATNRGIDEIRELRDAARYRPSRDKYKIYILDEAHQITDAAFNALLKTLEEPPDHIVFMMATTQPEDIPQTVRSRCQHFSFHAVKLADILGELRGIARHEGVDADDGALALLAEAGDGSMRDALSIMDQAIASAPVLDGRARLDAAQIRELMGTVPNAVFERILQAVDANRSAEVITIANDLLDAGNSPAQLARQAVRYLRSCVIAKIAGLTPDSEGGAGTELLQISPEEQRRAARTAALFTEEELTRFLQVMLAPSTSSATDRNSASTSSSACSSSSISAASSPSSRSSAPSTSALRPSAHTPAAPRPPPLPGPPHPRRKPHAAEPQNAKLSRPSHRWNKPAFSPFEQDRNRRRYDGIQGAATAPLSAPNTPPATPSAAPPEDRFPPAQPVTQPEPVSSPVPVTAPLPVAPPIPVPPPIPVAAPAPIAEPSIPTGEMSPLQANVVDALLDAKQASAADALGEATWTITNAEASIQTGLSHTMLPAVLNAQAEKIARDVARTLGVTKLTYLPRAANEPPPAKKPRASKAGSAQARALEHPMVQQAQRLFDAEIQTVIDLSGKD